MPESLHTDPLLLSRVANGDEAAFADLMGLYGPMVLHFIRQHCKQSELAEEIVQDIFTDIWLSREGLEEIRNFKGYLFVIARNYAIDAIRKLLREKERQRAYEQEGIDEVPSDLSEQQEKKLGILQRAVAELPPQQQRVWTLSRMEGYSYAQVAAEMGLSKETVKKYLQYATASIVAYVEARMDVLLVLLVLGEELQKNF